jgi:hypothetical protein
MIMMLEGAGTAGTGGTVTVVGGTTAEVGGAVVGTVVEEDVVVDSATVLLDAILIGGPVAEAAFVLVPLEQAVPTSTSAMVAAGSHLDTSRLISHIPPRSEPPTPSIPTTAGKIPPTTVDSSSQRKGHIADLLDGTYFPSAGRAGGR